jgi:hypothetical protein
MPTGYTGRITEDMSLREWALICVRAFGACIMQRDDDKNAPLITEYKVDNYYSDRMNECLDNVAALEKMSNAELVIKQIVDNNEDYESRMSWYKVGIAENRLYESMRDKVIAWEVTPEIQPVKTFMLDQIAISMCHPRFPVRKEEIPVSEYRAQLMKECAEDFKFAQKSYEDECRRVEECNKYIADFIACLPQN